MSDDKKLILMNLSMYADLILAAGNSGDDLKPETLTNVGLNLFQIVEQLKNIEE